MIIIENNTAKLNDIVFANRNKSYGAYAIRSNYGNTILKSLAVTALIFASISALAIMLNNTAPAEVKLDIGTNILPNDSIYYQNVEVTIPEPKTDVAQPIAKPVVTHNAEVVVPVIKDEIKETKKEVIQNPESQTGTEGKTNTNNVGDGETGSVEGKPNGTGSSTGMETKSSDPVLIPDVMPTFNIGPFLQNNLKYPSMALEANVSGKVIVNFIVDEQGNILKSTILKGIGYGCDEEALRVIKLMPKWTPGMVGGRPVKVSFNQVIIFKLRS